MPNEKTNNTPDEPMSPEPRFPRAAVDFIDALLSIQRQRFEKELGAAPAHAAAMHAATNPPSSMDVLAESDSFLGTGWSDLGRRRDGTAFRWMGRIGTLMCPVDMREGSQVRIEGAGFSRRRHLKTLSFWIDDKPIEGSISRRGFNRWIFEGSIGAVPARPYSILRIQSAGQSRLAVGVDEFVSVAVSRVAIQSKAD
ncbi:MAG: hypothetical protein JJ850_10175 [Kordiimonadaceae bacterium]|nr:hypothetical protein [Kordiimonadaceae bacterium]MBO6569500.1 hypothetical protein [Kordiimonadaceae bacterium]MBO6964975.1 hypothetical protein [Kordiimonadaceae bacterium]